VGHSRAEKAESRKRILAAASTRIREDGLDGISVGELMKSVNLTHGGFYGHFASRSALIAAALEKALDDGGQALSIRSADRGSLTVKSIVNNYLSPAHRDHPSSGCAIPSLAGEVGRADPEVRAIMAGQLAKSFEAMGAALGGGVAIGATGSVAEGADQDTEQFAISACSMMIGAMMISRIMKDAPQADRVLAMARKSILELEALHGGKSG
jgi:TetR/AcrR family transcriptional regulator, transcriptional repressor for nem operon